MQAMSSASSMLRPDDPDPDSAVDVLEVDTLHVDVDPTDVASTQLISAEHMNELEMEWFYKNPFHF